MVLFFSTNACREWFSGKLSDRKKWVNHGISERSFWTAGRNPNWACGLCRWPHSPCGNPGPRVLGPATSTPILLWCTCGLFLVTIFLLDQRFKFVNSSSNRLGIATLCGYRRYRRTQQVWTRAMTATTPSTLHVDHTAKPSEPGTSPDIHSQQNYQKTVMWANITHPTSPCPTIANLRYPAKKP